MNTKKIDGKFSFGKETIKATDTDGKETKNDFHVLKKEKYKYEELKAGGMARVDKSQKIFMSDEELEIVRGLLFKK